ncbi:hypothetical protein OEW28_01700 [Defluviimonas sp. WL0002]|uniref:Uncharacterized protein n=1 Tax=Albidovulum marisflavi TaxID=2984159 RepID=A0ABT2Z8B8_9RHOB|nr:hypothetical protein [Defluviimonas sp. WL0002]MCV2867341.1 hypothetical protein [Defluviimonas sp. WL0002]
MTHLRTVLALGACCAALPAAAGQFPLPQGCTAYATVQMRSCLVSQHYRCAGEPEGHQWAVQADGQGPYFANLIDAETRWLQSYDLYTGEQDQLAEERDPASFTELLESGRDEFDFFTESSFGELRRYVGHDRLTGRTETIDGIVLEQTEFELSAFDADGGLIWTRTGNQFVHRGWRIFFPGTEHFENSFGDTVDTVENPVEFALPGDKGFLEDEPKYDCDTLTASMQLPLMDGGPRP